MGESVKKISILLLMFLIPFYRKFMDKKFQHAFLPVVMHFSELKKN